MRLRLSFRKSRPTSNGPRPYRPVLEQLEDRCLLAGGFAQVNLASDLPGLAPSTDPNLVNPWGIAFSPTGPFWFANNGSSVSDLLDGRGQAVPLVVAVPSPAGAGSTPTGVVFNGGTGFVISESGASAPSRFLFGTEDGTISGWTSAVDPFRALLAVDNSSTGAVYKGLALATDPTGRSFLYAADFSHGTIDVFDQDFRPVVRPGSFQDSNLPNGFAPFNVRNINNLLFVAYAHQDETGRNEVAGAGQGFLDVYNTGGTLVRRLASQGVLNSPWGLALAPAGFGPFGGALLVGNTGDGRINAFDPTSGSFLGALAGGNGNPIAIPTLWALTFGNDHEGGAPDMLFFTAGVDYEQHGLFGAIQSPQRKGMDTAGAGTFDPNAPGESGDYPLPPRSGPALHENGADSRFMAAVLLPVRESSIVLIPTLSTISGPPNQSQEAAPVTALVLVSFQKSSETDARASSASRLLLSGDDSHPPSTPCAHALGLNALLDLNVAQTFTQAAAKTRVPDTNQDRDATADHHSPSEDDSTGAKSLLAESQIKAATERVKSRNFLSWTKWLKSLWAAVILPVIWAWCRGLGSRLSPRVRG
jgi:uncharacterized protein (TIGR03118 family)